MNKARTCRKCGKPIDVITQRLYRKIIVDALPVMVVPDRLGDEYIRLDGSKMRGLIAPMDSNVPAEGVFRVHRCGVNPDEM